MARRIGELLMEYGFLTMEDVTRCLSEQKRLRERLGRIAIRLGLAEERDIYRILAIQTNQPLLDLPAYVIEETHARLIPEHICRKHGCVAVNRRGRKLTVAMQDPGDVVAVDDLELMTGLEVKTILACPDDIVACLDETFQQPMATESSDWYQDYILRDTPPPGNS